MEKQIILSDGKVVKLPVFEKEKYDFTSLLYNLGYYDNKHIPENLIEDLSRYAIEKALKLDIEENFVGTKKQIDEELSKCKERAKSIYNVKMEDYNKIYPRWTEREQEFKNDMFEYFGVSDNPNADKAYSIAYERGHSDGFSEIYGNFSDLVDLIS